MYPRPAPNSLGCQESFETPVSPPNYRIIEKFWDNLPGLLNNKGQTQIFEHASQALYKTSYSPNTLFYI